MKFAVIGATKNKEKYGYIVFKYLKEQGHQVFPINPNYSEIDNVKTYKDVLSLNEDVDYFVFVTPPQVTLKVLNQIIKKVSNLKVWFQPGSEDQQCIDFCEKHNISYVANACIMHTNLDENSYFL
ncbi:MAG: uncharacterized protein PWP03_177 [Candidatus Woesearchaeota archaeon]|nr:uncharacterized protein [Candidatus Woesearchaeota archaeon]MDN5327539.1 uncharacterized protein [Candidatus Woesearchaeota archaeon]